MANNKLAIIGGSGLYDVEEFIDREHIKLNTPWGEPSDVILKTKYNDKDVFFLPRHGRGHFISPSKINFRANIDAFKQLGVTDIVSISAVGSLKKNLEPGKSRHIQNIGYILRRQGKIQESLKNLHTALDISPNEASLAFQIMLSYEQTREYKKVSKR